MDINDIGSTDVTALLCHTNRPPPPGRISSGGDWFSPDGTRVGDKYYGYDAVPGLLRNRAPMLVRLIRNTRISDPAEGIYQCRVSDNAGTLQTLSVGIYSAGRGKIQST